MSSSRPLRPSVQILLQFSRMAVQNVFDLAKRRVWIGRGSARVPRAAVGVSPTALSLVLFAAAEICPSNPQPL
jgi:hypothetical protein